MTTFRSRISINKPVDDQIRIIGIKFLRFFTPKRIKIGEIYLFTWFHMIRYNRKWVNDSTMFYHNVEVIRRYGGIMSATASEKPQDQ